MSKLRIAITADTYPYASDVTNLVRAPFTARGLVDVIHELGALPIVLPDVPDINGSDYAELFDALVIPGGPDMDPTFYGEEPTWKIGTTNYLRDVLKRRSFTPFTGRASRSSASAAAASSSIRSWAARSIRICPLRIQTPISAILRRAGGLSHTPHHGGKGQRHRPCAGGNGVCQFPPSSGDPRRGSGPACNGEGAGRRGGMRGVCGQRPDRRRAVASRKHVAGAPGNARALCGFHRPRGSVPQQMISPKRRSRPFTERKCMYGFQ